MTLDEIKSKWEGVQSVWKDGCYLFSLCTILDECGVDYDLWELTRTALKEKWIRDDGYILRPISILEHYTGYKFVMEAVGTLPSVVQANMYTIEKWYNKRTGYTHFKRRFVDTLVNSTTVREGERVGYYLFTKGGKVNG